MTTYTMARPLPRAGGSLLWPQLVLVGMLSVLCAPVAYRASRARWKAFQLAPEWGPLLVRLNWPSKTPYVARHRRQAVHKRRVVEMDPESLGLNVPSWDLRTRSRHWLEWLCMLPLGLAFGWLGSFFLWSLM